MCGLVSGRNNASHPSTAARSPPPPFPAAPALGARVLVRSLLRTGTPCQREPAHELGGVSRQSTLSERPASGVWLDIIDGFLQETPRKQVCRQTLALGCPHRGRFGSQPGCSPGGKDVAVNLGFGPDNPLTPLPCQHSKKRVPGHRHRREHASTRQFTDKLMLLTSQELRCEHICSFAFIAGEMDN